MIAKVVDDIRVAGVNPRTGSSSSIAASTSGSGKGGVVYLESARLAVTVHRHAEGGKEFRNPVGFIEPDLGRVIAKKKGRVCAHPLGGRGILKVEMGEALQFMAKKSRLPHLAGAKHKDDRELAEVGLQVYPKMSGEIRLSHGDKVP